MFVYQIKSIFEDELKRGSMLTVEGPNGTVRVFMSHYVAKGMKFKVGDELRSDTLIEDYNSKPAEDKVSASEMILLEPEDKPLWVEGIDLKTGKRYNREEDIP